MVPLRYGEVKCFLSIKERAQPNTGAVHHGHDLELHEDREEVEPCQDARSLNIYKKTRSTKQLNHMRKVCWEDISPTPGLQVCEGRQYPLTEMEECWENVPTWPFVSGFKI